jgi:hypothetical protein
MGPGDAEEAGSGVARHIQAPDPMRIATLAAGDVADQVGRITGRQRRIIGARRRLMTDGRDGDASRPSR